MSDFARLKETLSKLRARERAPSEGRSLQGGTGPALLASLVSEINETILPRRLSFTIDGSAQIHLAVANRRLQALLAPAPAGDGFDGLDGQPLPDIEDANVATLGEALLAAFSDAGAVSIGSAKLTEDFGSDIGVPANQLGRVWTLGQDEPAEAPDVALAGFLEDMKAEATAWLRIEGENVASEHGEADAVAALGEQTAVFLDGYFSKFDRVFPDPALACGTVISPSPKGSNALFFVEAGDISAVISAKPKDILGIAQKWQNRVAR